MGLVKAPHKVARRFARQEIIAQLNEPSIHERTRNEKLEAARVYTNDAMDAFHAAVQEARRTLANTMAAIDPELSEFVESDNYNESYYTTYYAWDRHESCIEPYETGHTGGFGGGLRHWR